MRVVLVLVNVIMLAFVLVVVLDDGVGLQEEVEEVQVAVLLDSEQGVLPAGDSGVQVRSRCRDGAGSDRPDNDDAADGPERGFAHLSIDVRQRCALEAPCCRLPGPSRSHSANLSRELLPLSVCL